MHQLPFDGSLAQINHQYYIQGEPLSWIQITVITFQIKKHKQLCTIEEIFCENFDQKKKIFTDVLVYD